LGAEVGEAAGGVVEVDRAEGVGGRFIVVVVVVVAVFRLELGLFVEVCDLGFELSALVAAGEGGGGAEFAGLVGGGEALAEVGEAEDVVEFPELLGLGSGVVGDGLEALGGVVGGGGEVEVGAEAEGGLDGAEGGAEGRAAELLAEDGGGGPGVGGWAGGVGDEGA
jgi:hypothetical protein